MVTKEAGLFGPGLHPSFTSLPGEQFRVGHSKSDGVRCGWQTKAQRARLQEAMTKATETVLAALNSENEAVRLKTAFFLLDHCGLAELTPDAEETARAVEVKRNPILQTIGW